MKRRQPLQNFSPKNFRRKARIFSLSRRRKNAVKIKVYHLSYGNVYAANTYDSYGRRVILINSVYANAPVEQIACLIAHESCHVARKATLEEETIATSKEAACWAKLKKAGVAYPQTKFP